MSKITMIQVRYNKEIKSEIVVANKLGLDLSPSCLASLPWLTGSWSSS